MSLISDALKKAQSDRNKLPQPDTEQDLIPHPKIVNNPKRIMTIIISILVVCICLTILSLKLSLSQQQLQFIQAKSNAANVLPESKFSSANVLNQTTPAKPNLMKQTTQIYPLTELNSKKSSQKVALPAQINTIDHIAATVKTPAKEVSKSEPIPSKPKPINAKSSEQKIIKILPDPSTQTNSSQEDIIKEGDQYLSDNNVQLAIQKYRQALAIKKTTDLYIKLYQNLSSLDNAILANAYLQEGLQNFPQDFLLNKVMAIVKIREKLFSDALQYINIALKMKPDDTILLTYKGLSLFHLKQYEAALVSLLKSREIDGNKAENYYYLGLIYDNLQDYNNALQFYKRFLELNGNQKNFKHRQWLQNRIMILEKEIH